MLIYPVLDLLGGVAVHAVGGVRNEYQPLVSCGCASACPLEITQRIGQQYGLADWYVADLDGIVHRRWNFELAGQLLERGVGLRVDWGIREVEDLMTTLASVPACRTILCSETLQDRSVFDAICGMVDPQQITFSVDLIDGQLNCPPGAWGTMSLPDIVEHVQRAGLTELIVLDVAYVGCDRGPGTLPVCQQLRDLFPDMTLLTGGGVQSVDDLQRLEAAGVDGVLLGSCLHQQRVSAEQLRPYGLSGSSLPADSLDPGPLATGSKMSG